jgi:RNA polymerase sigma-70 factor, ECF subfamily
MERRRALEYIDADGNVRLATFNRDGSERVMSVNPDASTEPLRLGSVRERRGRGLADDFAEVYAQQLEAVWRYVRARVPGHADAEDVTSEVFVRAAEGWARYDARRGSISTWLFGIAHHVVADWWRRLGREVPWEPIDIAADSRSPSAPDPEDAVLAGAARAEVRSHLGRLTERERDAVALRFGAGLKAAEVGAVLGVSETAARMLVYRAVTKLRAVIRR